MKSSWQQYDHQPDGSIGLVGRPDVGIEVIQDQGRVTGRNIEAELCLPKYFEEWEVLAKPRGLSRHQIQFIVMDQSKTRFPDRYRFQPQRVTLPSTCHLEFGHRGFVVGIVHTFLLGFEELREQIPSMFSVELPTAVRGTTSLPKPHCLTPGWVRKPGRRSAWESLRILVRWYFARLRNPPVRDNSSRLVWWQATIRVAPARRF